MVLILTADEVLRKGLQLVGFDCRRQRNASSPTNLRRFRTHYGSNPSVYAQIWEDLQTTMIPEACLVINGDIPLDGEDGMELEAVYLQRPEFADFEFAHFKERLRDLRRQIKDKDHSAASDSAALAHDRQICPKAAYNHRGEPRWEGSEAERLLRLDVDNDKHKTMQPKDLHGSRTEYYKNYAPTVLRKHIEQEERRRKMLSYYAAKNKDLVLSRILNIPIGRTL